MISISQKHACFLYFFYTKNFFYNKANSCSCVNYWDHFCYISVNTLHYLQSAQALDWDSKNFLPALVWLLNLRSRYLSTSCLPALLMNASLRSGCLLLTHLSWLCVCSKTDGTRFGDKSCWLLVLKPYVQSM